MASSAPRAEPRRVAIFAKAPVPGTVKTRLVPLLGPEGACALHRRLVEHSVRTARDSGSPEVELWCAPHEDHAFFRQMAASAGVRLRRQPETDLGARMQAAADAALDEGVPILIIGSDCPALTPAHLREAAAQLAAQDVVLAPAEDGGYVLVGVARRVPGLFSDIAWGTDEVMSSTRERLSRAGARWHELPMLWDVDRPADYERAMAAGLLPSPAGAGP